MTGQSRLRIWPPTERWASWSARMNCLNMFPDTLGEEGDYALFFDGYEDYVTIGGGQGGEGKWQHISITYDNEQEIKKLYIDGELAAESNDSVFPNDTKPFNIGAGGDQWNWLTIS